MNQSFKDFFIKANIAVNHVFRLSKFMDYKLNFLRMEKDEEFERAASKLISKSPEARDLVEMLRGDRTTWFGFFADLRNRIEHESLPRLEVKYSGQPPCVQAHFPQINDVGFIDLAQNVWENLFEFVEDTVVSMLSFRLREPHKIATVPAERRNPGNLIKYVITADLHPITGTD